MSKITTKTTAQLPTAQKTIGTAQTKSSGLIRQQDSFERAGPDSRLDTIDLSKFENVGAKEGSLRVGDLLNGMLPGFGKSVDPGNASKEIAPGFKGPEIPGSSTDALDLLGFNHFGANNQAHGVGAIATMSDTDFGNALTAGVGAIGTSIASTGGAAAAGAFGVGFGVGLVGNAVFERATGKMPADYVYDWLHPDHPADSGDAKPAESASTDAGSSSVAGTDGGTETHESGEDDPADGGTKAEGSDGGSETTESGSASQGEETSSASKIEESSETTESADEPADKSSGDEESESGVDPEVSTRYRPTTDEIQNQFGRTAVNTTARSNPNPNAEDTSGVSITPTLQNNGDARLVNPDGRNVNIGTAVEFGTTHMSTINTVRPADKDDSPVVTPGGKFGGANPAA